MSGSSSSHRKSKPEKDIVVSILLTESTSKILKLDLPHLEDLETENSEPTVCTIKAETALAEKQAKTSFFKSWFQKNNNMMSQDIAYFSNKSVSDESSTSIDQKKTVADEEGSSSSLDQKLIPVKVYTRPLFAVNSLAHQDNIKSNENNIYISLTKSQTHVSDSWVNVCRICHGGESIGDLLSVCHCRGSIALTHRSCLERWLKESSTSHCELCQYHFMLIREPKYSVLKSIFVYLRHPGECFQDIMYDTIAFLVYTPAAIGSTYMLMLLCESVTKSSSHFSRNTSAQIMTFLAVFGKEELELYDYEWIKFLVGRFKGMAAIDFTYSSWLMVNLQKHLNSWRNWYRNNCEIKLILPERKRKRSDDDFESTEDEVD